jgi:O-antigen/teichoic acid export membrane protein
MSKKLFVNSVLWSFVQQFGFVGVNFVVSIVLARILMPSEFGLYGITLIFSGIANLISDGGMASSLIRTKNSNDSDYSIIFWFNVLISFILYLIIYIAAPFIADFYDKNELILLLRVVCLSIIISSFTTVHSTRLTKEMQFKKKAILSFPSLVFSGSIGIFLSLNSFGVWSLVYRDLSFSIILGILLWITSAWKPKFQFSFNKFKYHFDYGYKLLFTSLLSKLFTDSYKLIIGKFLSLNELGFFTRAKSMEELPNQIVFNTINKVLFPMLSLVQDDNEKLKKSYGQIIKLVTFLVTPFMILLFLIAKPLFVFLLTDKWLPAVPYFKILILAAIITPLQPYLLNICKVKGRSDLVLKLSLIEYFFIFFSLFMIVPFGMYGLLWGLVIASLCKLIVAMIVVAQLINYSVKNQLSDLKEGFLVSLFLFPSMQFLYYLGLFKNFHPVIEIIIVSVIFYTILISISLILKFESTRIIRVLLLKKNNF